MCAVATDVPAQARPPATGGAAQAKAPTKAPTWSERFLALFINPKKNAHLAGLDTIRGIAVLFVVLYHCWALSGLPVVNVAIPLTGLSLPVSHFISGMGYGVDIFFVLSGFLLAIPWHKAHYEGTASPRLGAYLKRRMLRIVPPYWFMWIILLLLLTGSVIPWEAVGNKSGVANIVANLLFLQHILPPASSSFGVNGAVWTLTIEMIFYLILPVFVLPFLGRRWQISLPLAIMGSFAWIYLAYHSLQPLVDLYWNSVKIYGVPEDALRPFTSTQFPSTLMQFGLGMTLANLWAYRSRAVAGGWFAVLTHPLTSALAALLGLVLLGYGIYHVQDATVTGATEGYQYLTHFAATMGTGLLILGALSAGRVFRALYAFVPLRFVGIIGYSVFLWHFPMITLMERYPIFAQATPYDRWLGMTLVVVPAVLVLGAILFLLVEKPFIESRQRATTAVREATPSVAEALIELQETKPLVVPALRIAAVPPRSQR